jgi:transposase
MGEVSTIGLDIAKSVFQVHGVDDAGTLVMRKRINRSKVLQFFGELSPCLVGLEACPSAHYWSRELQAPWPHSEADAAELCEGIS